MGNSEFASLTSRRGPAGSPVHLEPLSNGSGHGAHPLDRRNFLRLAARGSVGAMLAWTPSLFATPTTVDWDPQQPFRTLGKALKVQPIFMYALPTKKEKASWRSWGGVQTEAAVNEEVARITGELTRMAAKAEFPLQLLPVAKITSSEAADALAKDPALAGFAGRVSDSGEGRWTIKAAIDEGVPAPVLTTALYARFSSRGDSDFQDKLLSAMRYGFGGHLEKSAK